MSGAMARLRKLETAADPNGCRFITVQGDGFSDTEVHAFLDAQGVTVRPDKDVLFIETPADPGTAGYVAPGQPLSLVSVCGVGRIEDWIDELDKVP